MPEVSVIIPTCARPVQLEGLLAGLCRTLERRFPAEVLVVDTGRQTVVRDLCAESRFRGLNIRYIPCFSRTLHAGRHLGARLSAGDVLLFADDDIVPSATWVAAVHDAFRDPELALGGGECLPKYEAEPPPWVDTLWKENEHGNLLFAFSLIRRSGGARAISPFYVFGCNYAVRKSVLMKSGGFHPDGLPAEHMRFRGDGESSVSAYVQDEGLKCMHIPDAGVWHCVPPARMTFEYIYRRYFMQAVSDSYTKVRRKGCADWVPRYTRMLDGIGKIWPRSRALPWGPAVRHLPQSLQSVIALGCRDGAIFHQREVRRDSRLLQWILRNDYWDVGLPGEKVNHPA